VASVGAEAVRRNNIKESPKLNRALALIPENTIPGVSQDLLNRERQNHVPVRFPKIE
jgi:hypothetical protein